MEQTTKRKRKAIPILVLFFFVIFFIIFLVILYIFKTKKDDTSDGTATESAQNQDEGTTNTRSEDPQITDETPSCAPIYTGGKITSSTSTETTWSYYFSEATSEGVLGYVEDLKGNGWSTISEQTIANTSFWDLQKENCYINLRYHSPDGGVILEIREEIN
jgi:hypothetical protein